MNALNHFAAVLQKNKITINDGVVEFLAVIRTTGLAQEGHLSPLLFSILLKALPGQMRRPMRSVLFFMHTTYTGRTGKSAASSI